MQKKIKAVPYYCRFILEHNELIRLNANFKIFPVVFGIQDTVLKHPIGRKVRIQCFNENIANTVTVGIDGSNVERKLI